MTAVMSIARQSSCLLVAALDDGDFTPTSCYANSDTLSLSRENGIMTTKPAVLETNEEYFAHASLRQNCPAHRECPPHQASTNSKNPSKSEKNMHAYGISIYLVYLFREHLLRGRAHTPRS